MRGVDACAGARAWIEVGRRGATIRSAGKTGRIFRMKKKSLKHPDRLGAILTHFQPNKSKDFASLKPEFQGLMIGLMSTPSGQKRNKERDAYNAEQEWQRNLAFVCGLHTLVPPDNSVLKIQTEKLLLSMFGAGFSADRLRRFNASERKRIKKNGEAAWRLVSRLRKHYGLPD